MSSIIEGYNYDIFISYRQKDNKGDRWVSEFVDSLKTELESTFKEEISVYFDINPHDGLLETHDVDESLKEKLKCLVFIPIISRTYCDPMSFAWEHEFKAFVEIASKDQFGLKIKLHSGNVANRVLPVRIHDLDTADIKECESITRGVLRGVEFIYREPGVNKPLTVDDNENKNLNGTKYRIQINKTANAIKEILEGLTTEPSEITREKQKPITFTTKKSWNKTRKILIYSFSFLLVIASVLIITKFNVLNIRPEKSATVLPLDEKSIAVLPFDNLSNDPDQKYFSSGLVDEILDRLGRIGGLIVKSRSSSDRFKDSELSLKEIGIQLGASAIMKGSVQKIGNSIRISVQLNDSKSENQMWSKIFNLDFSDIFSIYSQVADAVVGEMKVVISPEEKQLIEKPPTANLAAYDLYLRANNYLNDYEANRDLSFYNTAVNLYKEALEIDSAFPKAYTGMARAYYDRYQWETYFLENYLDSMKVLADKALSLDNQLDEAYFLKGYYFRLIGDQNRALANFDKAIEFNPNYYRAYRQKATVLFTEIGDYVGGLITSQKALTLMSGNERPSGLRELGYRYLNIGFVNKAKSYYKEAFGLDSNQISYLNGLMWIEFCQGNFENALSNQKQKYEIDSTILPQIELMLYNITPGHKEEAYLMAKKKIDFNKKSGSLALQEAFQIGYALSQVGQVQEANKYFKEQITYDEESIRLSRIISQLGYAQYDLASTYAFLGDKAKAYNYLEEFANNNFQNLWQISYAKHNYFMNSISNEERYQKILQKMEAKYQAEHERVRNWLEGQGML